MSETPLQQSFTPNPALYTNQAHDLYLAESPGLHPSPDECIVHVRCNGICGSDVHFWKTGAIGTLEVDRDYVLGHEGSGVVVWTGTRVTHLQIGDRVAIEPGVPCGECFQCSSGCYNLCPSVAFTGVPPHNGSIRRYHVHSAKFLHKLPESLSFADGALLEPLSVVLHGFERTQLLLGESTVICGAGPIGLIALAAARQSGAFPLVITDIEQSRLDFAATFIPGCTPVLIQKDKSPQQMAQIINESIVASGGEQPRAVYECTGVQNSVVTAAYIPRPGGEVMVIGVGRPIMNEIPFMHVSLAEVDLKFINRYHHTWPRAMRLLSSGYIDLKPLITHHFPLSEAVDALTSSTDRSKNTIKVHIVDGE